jgi:hypothetical protein
MQSSHGSDRLAEALARFERTILEPIVEGEVALRVTEMYGALVDLDQSLAQPVAAEPQAMAPQSATAVDIMSEQTRLTAQSGELVRAARALKDRAARVEPDEKRVQDEVDAFVLQARQFVIALRQLEQARHSGEAVASHD